MKYMNIKDLLDGKVNNISIDEEFTIPKEEYANTDIIDLEKVKVIGNLTYPSDDNLFLEAFCSGVMKLNDSVSLEPVDYKFSFKINENVYEKLEKDKFSLDIISILWENIVLEIPIRYSEVNNYDKYKGDGWRVISEDDVNITNTNNPFKDLLKEIEKE